MTRPRLFVPAVTPFAEDLSVDRRRLVAHSRLLLEDGADGLAPFGTTSEATSMSVEERIAALEALVEGGVAPDRLIPGTGCAALPDTIRLTAHATALGVKGVLALPPFYYKPPDEDGIFAAYARTIEAVAAEGTAPRLYLYHIPQMSGVPITLTLIRRLAEGFPGVVAGLKDSSGDWDNTAAVIEAFPGIETFSASETLIPANAAAGGAGCISATANVNAAGIARLIRALGTAEEAEALAAAKEIRDRFSALPLIPAIKAAVARRLGDPAFGIVRPPLSPLARAHDALLAEAAALCFGEPARV